MIGKVVNSVVPKAVHRVGSATVKNGRFDKFLKSESLGKVLELAADNEPVLQSVFGLALCVVARPITNFLITEDKKDAAYASCHSISSGTVGLLWSMAFATPVAMATKAVFKNPAKYLKPNIIKKFYPSAVVEDVIKDGKKVGEKIKTNAKGELLRKDGSKLISSTEPLMVFGKDAQAAFEKAHPEVYVEPTGVVRSKNVFKTKNGVLKLDKDGNKVGCAVQEDLTPITEEMKIAALKEKNVKNIVKMSVDVLLAPPRAILTIGLIPWIMKNIFRLSKGNSKKTENVQNSPKMNMSFTPTVFDNFKKGGV